MGDLIKKFFDLGITDPWSATKSLVKFTADAMEERSERRYQEFIRTVLDGGAFPENIDGLTSEDFIAIMRTLDAEMEEEKTHLYARLASSIGHGKVPKHLRKHFVKCLRDLGWAQIQHMSQAWVASVFPIYPGQGSGNLDQANFLGHLPPYEMLLVQQLGLVDGAKNKEALTEIGTRFVECCFTEEELTPEARRLTVWNEITIDIICNEMGDDACSDVILALTTAGQANRLKVRQRATVSFNIMHTALFRGEFVILLYRDPQRILSDWESVKLQIKKEAKVVTASFDDAPSDPELAQFPHYKIDGDSLGEVVDTIIADALKIAV